MKGGRWDILAVSMGLVCSSFDLCRAGDVNLAGRVDAPELLERNGPPEMERAGGDPARVIPIGAAPAEWLLVMDPSGPKSRYGHAMAYDSARKRVVLFGGLRSPDGPVLSDTWEWDGFGWTRRMPSSSPPARFGHAMAYDSTRGRVVLFGGWGRDLFADTWEWDGNFWIERSPGNAPAPRYAHAMAYDSARRQVVLFGGEDPNGFYSPETWEWDGERWTDRTSALAPAERGEHAIAYDSARGRVVLFGGCGYDVYGDTWEWDGSQWTGRAVSGGPSSRCGHAMTYDSARGRVILYGGYDGANSAETWAWDGTRWSNLKLASRPGDRRLHALAYDAVRGRVVSFGGYRGKSLSETLEYGPGVGCGHATRVVEFLPGSGTGSTSADSAVGPSDGMTVSLGLGGRLVLEFEPAMQNRAGGDFIVYAKGAGEGAIDENYSIEVSEDNITYVAAGTCPGGGCQFDLEQSRLSRARYLRVTDLPPQEPGTDPPNTGVDVDAVAVLHCAQEICNGIDDDRDGTIDAGCDDDEDGYCDATMITVGTPPICPGGAGDCDDQNASIHTNAEETCSDALDGDCDGLADTVDPSCTPMTVAPSDGTVGTTIAVTGPSFGPSRQGGRRGSVRIGTGSCTVSTWSENLISCRLDAPLRAGTYDVTVREATGGTPIVLGQAFNVRPPAITAVTPASAQGGALVTLAGRYFGSRKGKVTLGERHCSVSSWTVDSVVIRVPRTTGRFLPGVYPLKVGNRAGSSDPFDFGLR